MKALVRLFVCLGAVALVNGAVNAEAVRVPCGEVVGLRLLNSNEINMEWDESRFDDRPTLEEGEKFAVVKIRLDEGKSIGKRDYMLAGNKCLAIALNINAFHPKTWVYENEPEGAQVRLLFKVKESDDNVGYTLTYNYGAPLGKVYKNSRAKWVSQTISTRNFGPGDAAAVAAGDDDDDAAGDDDDAVVDLGDDDDDDDEAAAGDDDDEPAPVKKEEKPAKKEEEKPAKKEENVWDI